MPSPRRERAGRSDGGKNPGAAPHPRIPDLTQIRLIDYDFAKYGDPEVRRRILARWDREIGSLPR